MSARGGQGRSSLAVAVARSLASGSVGETLFIDGCTDGSATAALLDSPSITYDYGDVVRGVCDPADAIYPAGSGLSMMPAAADDSFLVEQSVLDMLETVKRRFDWVILDCPSGSYWRLAALSKGADMSVMCSRADKPGLACAAKLRRLLPEEDERCRLAVTAFSTKELTRGSIENVDRCIDTVEAMLLGVVPDDPAARAVAAANIAGRLMGKAVPLMKLK